MATASALAQPNWISGSKFKLPKLIGQTFLNQFRVDEFVASGGLGAVYRVWDLQRNVPLAMKVLHSELADDPSMFKRFQREANALKKLAHPNIVPFYGMYQVGDFAFLLERFIDGPSLKDVLRQRQDNPLPVNEALIFFKALCAALGYAHSNGVVHCDIKPGNVMIDRGGNIYLTDFGIARHSESTTTTMGPAGTIPYMAPEQIRGEQVSAATDVYALGVVLFEMVTGQRPFRGTEVGTENGGGTITERICYGHLHLQPPDPRTINPALSPRLANAILKALAKKSQDRYASTQEFFNTVCAQAGGIAEDVDERVVLPPIFTRSDVSKGGEVVAGNHPVPNQEHPPKQRSPWLIVGGIVGVLAVCAAAIGGIILLSGQWLPVVPSGMRAPAATQPENTVTRPPNTNAPILPPTDTAPAPTVPLTDTPQPLTDTPTPMDGMVMVYVPPGDFRMGDQGNVVSVNAFWIDKTEVTNGMFTKFVMATSYITQVENDRKGNTLDITQGNPWVLSPDVNWRHPHAPFEDISNLINRPVVQISWSDADKYCQWAGRRLPTNAEWEKAARGTEGKLYPWGNSAPNPGLLNYNIINHKADFNSQLGNLVDVGSYPAGISPYGALDMLGNAWEWVYDLSGVADYRVFRGGSWWDDIGDTVSSYTKAIWPTYSGETLGFRCAQDATP